MSFLHKVQLEEIDKITPKKTRSRIPQEEKNSFYEGGNWAVVTPYLLFLSAFVILVSRTFYLQIVEGGKNEALSLGNSVRYSFERAERGVIFDRNNNVVARNSPGFSVELNTTACIKTCDDVIDKVSKLINVDRELVNEQMSKGYAQVTIASGLTRDDIIKVESNLNEFVGVSTQVDPLRDYISPESFAHLLGFVGSGEGPDRVGKAGVEETYDKYLHGTPGSKIIEINSSGTHFTQIAENPPVRGKNLYLYVDKNVQEVAYNALKEAVDAKKATGGAVIAQDPYTGGILALVSYPSFNPNAFSKGISNTEFSKIISDERKPFFNRAISATYPPGSTFKMVTSLAALEKGVIKNDSLVDCPSSISVGGSTFRDWYSGGRGPIDVKRALQVSCDTFFYAVGGGYGEQRGVGITEIANLSRKLGFGHKFGVDIEGETAGVFPDVSWKKEVLGEQWYLGDTYITAIGQGNILVTPLQLNSMVSFFATRGKIYKPKVVKLVEGEGQTFPELFYEDTNSSTLSYLNTIREGMKMVVNAGGTAYPLFDFTQRHPGVELAGKTGTAEFGNPVEEGGAKTHAWFVVFGPYERPNIVLTVFLEGGGGGSTDAAPVARKILDAWFK